jgi:resuscitation-promoting factor RpfA
MADNPAKDPAGEEKVGPGKDKKKGGMLTGKNKWYVIGGLGIVAVLVFYFVSRSNANQPGGTATTAGGGLDPSTQAALQSALQGQAAAGGYAGLAGPAGPAGPAGERGKTGKTGKVGRRGPSGRTGKTGDKGPPGHTHPHHHSSKPRTQFYTVRPGDSLSRIASRHNISGGWHTLYRENRGVIGSNPNVIHPGQRLRI